MFFVLKNPPYYSVSNKKSKNYSSHWLEREREHNKIAFKIQPQKTIKARFLEKKKKKKNAS